MDLSSRIDERLWRAIESAYSGRNFTGAILDAVYFISDVIRDRTGLDSDGVALAGQAFGGKNPKLKVNACQTETEKSVQTGVEQLLRGLYRAIRNPRSHEKHVDTQEHAVSIIMFIDYLLEIIDKAKAPFTKSEFIDRVFDSRFVKKKRYSDLLVAEIPKKHRLAVARDVFRMRETGDGECLKFFMASLLAELDADDRKEFILAVSADLMVAESQKAVRLTVQIIPSDVLTDLTETARMRLENMLIESVRDGKYDGSSHRCISGALGTWARGWCQSFLLKQELIDVLVEKVRARDAEESAYVHVYFWTELRDLVNPLDGPLRTALLLRLVAGDSYWYEKLKFEREFGDSAWVEPLNTVLDEFPARDSGSTDDDLPF